MVSRRRVTNDVGSVVPSVAVFSKNSPGRRRVVPYKSSATLVCRSLLTAVRIYAQKSKWQCLHPVIGSSLRFEGRLELAMEPFNHAICDRVVGCCAKVLAP